MRRWLVALAMLVLGRGRRPPRLEREERIVPEAPPSPGSELVVLALFGLAAKYLPIFPAEEPPALVRAVPVATTSTVAVLENAGD